jgi:heterodisulfide reductase subunit D
MFKKLFGKMGEKLSSMGGNTLYYPGCLTRFAAQDLEENYKTILTDVGVDFISIPEFNCCGSPAINAGYRKEFDELIEKNKALFKKYGVKRIITNCPSCYRIFKEEYKIPVEHISQTLFKNIDKLEQKYDAEKICYHDPCHLGRHSGIYKEPRKVLEALGFQVVEMAAHKDASQCCGAGAGLKTNYPEIASKAAKQRLLQCREKKLVTTCALCYKHIKENAPVGLEVFEFSELLVKNAK